MKTAFPTSRQAHAKLNLRLEVGPKSGRLHAVVSAIATLEIADEITFEPASAGFSVACLGAAIPESENLVWRAAYEFGSPPDVAVTIRKHIPLQAGLGGGSADAAETLAVLAWMFAEMGRPVPPDTVHAAAVRLGSDVPAALVPGLKIVSGVGERVTSFPCSAPPWGIVLLKPPAGSDTAQAYASLDVRGAGAPLGAVSLERARAVCEAFAAHDFDRFVSLLHNDFGEPIEAALPAVVDARDRLQQIGAKKTILCGSGSCVAGFFLDHSSASAAREALDVRSGEWCAVTRFYV